MATRSTTAGTPVKSWWSTRAGVKLSSRDGSSVADPAGDGLHVGLGAGAQRVLEQDAQRERQARDVVAGLKRVQPEDLVFAAADLQR